MRFLPPALFLGPALVMASPAQAQSSIPAAAEASGDVVGASVEVSARLAATGVTVTTGTVIGVTGTTAAVLTGDEDVFENSWELAGKIAAAPLSDLGPLPVDDDILVADPAPDVPFDGRRLEMNREEQD